jgi:hypothetical protein
MTEEEKAAQEAQKKAIDEALELVKGTNEFNSILKNHAESYAAAKEDEFGRKAQGKAYRNIDDAIAEAGYTPKEEGVFTSDYAAQLAKDYLKVSKELEELKGGSDDQKDQANKEKEDLYNSRIEAANKKAEAAEKALLIEIAKGKRKEIASLLESGANTVNFHPTMPDTVVSATKQARINEVIANSKEIDGKTIYYDENGKEFQRGDGMPMTAMGCL